MSEKHVGALLSQDFSRHNKWRYEVGFITCLKFECMKPWA